MKRLLIIDEKSKEEILRVKKFAKKNIYDDEYRIGIIGGYNNVPGDDPNHVVHFHIGFKAVYTVNKIEDKLYHHLSLSYERGWIGIPEASTILKEFGIVDDIHDVDNVWMEEELKAINFIKIIEDNE